MVVFLDDMPVDLLPGMTVRHLLLGAGRNPAEAETLLVVDQWGNRVGFDGAVTEGMRLYTGKKSP